VFGQGAPLPSGVVRGSQVTVIGTLKDFNNDTMGNPLRELGALSVTKGSGSVNANSIVPLAMQASALADPKYVGSLVTLTHVKVMTPQSSANHYTGVFQQGTTTFHASGTIVQDTDAAATCYSTITGVWSYDVYDNDYMLVPIAAGTSGTGC
jgi:hypothetical protein